MLILVRVAKVDKGEVHERLIFLVMYIWALDICRNRTIPNRITFLLVIFWPIWLGGQMKSTELLMMHYGVSCFVTCVLITVGIVTKIYRSYVFSGREILNLLLSPNMPLS